MRRTSLPSSRIHVLIATLLLIVFIGGGILPTASASGATPVALRDPPSPPVNPRAVASSGDLRHSITLTPDDPYDRASTSVTFRPDYAARTCDDTTPPSISNVSESDDPIYRQGCPNPTESTISASVSDPSGLSWVRLYYQYTPGGSYLYRSMTLESGSRYRVAVGPFFRTGEYQYYIKARDNAGNERESSTYSVTVIDCGSTPPSISSVSESHDPIYRQGCPSPTESTISASVSDSSGLSWVRLYYQQSPGGSYAYRSMTLESGSTYKATIGPFSSTGEYSYYIKACDNTGSQRDSSTYSVTVVDCDSTPPSISNVSESDDPINRQGCPNPTQSTISASVSDASGLSWVRLYYQYTPGGSYVYRSMTLESGSTYKATIGPFSSTGEYHYYIKARDNTGNEKQSSTYSLMVNDCDVAAPSISNVSESADPINKEGCPSPTTVTIRADVSDASGLSWVRLYYQQTPGGSYTYGVMTLQSGSTYQGTMGPFSQVGTVLYYLKVRDNAGNEGQSGTLSITVNECDSTPPSISNVSESDDPINRQGCPDPTQSTISASVSDSSGLSWVRLYYQYSPGGSYAYRNMTLESGSTYKATIGPFSSTGEYHYYIKARDNAGNEKDSSTYSLMINDCDVAPPSISNVRESADPINKQACDEPTTVTISADVSDPSGLAWVRLYYTPPGGAEAQTDMTTSGGNTYQATIGPFSQVGTVHYYVKARDNAGNESQGITCWVTIDDCAPIDLSIDSVEPVQVLEGLYLVRNKATAVKVVIRKSGTGAANDVPVRAYDGTHTYTRFYVAEPGNTDGQNSLVSDNAMYPLSFESHESTKSVYFFDSSLAPAGSTLMISATVDYLGHIAETDETNNDAMSASLAVHDVRWSGQLFPNLYVHYFRTDWGSTSLGTFDSYCQASNDFLRGVYPVSGERFTPGQSSVYVGSTAAYRLFDWKLNTLELGLWILDTLPKIRLAHPTADRFIAVVPPGWFAQSTTDDLRTALGVAYPAMRGLVVAEARTTSRPNGPSISAHEIGHSYGLCLTCEEYESCNPTRRDLIGNYASAGLWVEKRIPIQTSSTRPIYCFMGGYADEEYWVDANCYSGLLDAHKIASASSSRAMEPDTRAILAVGIFHFAGSVTLDSWYVLPEAELSTLLPGPYAFEYQDESGRVLHTQSFDVSYVLEGGYTLNESPFVFTIPYIPDTARIAVKHGDVALTEKVVSCNGPEVALFSPNGGERLFDEATISWVGSDADGDELSYAILFSRDSGASWEAVAANLSATSYVWTVAGLPPDAEYLVKVIATDGFNTGFDVSDNVFAVRAPMYLPLMRRAYIRGD